MLHKYGFNTIYYMHDCQNCKQYALKYFKLTLLPNLTDLCNYAQMLQIVRGIYHGFFLLSISEKAIHFTFYN